MSSTTTQDGSLSRDAERGLYAAGGLFMISDQMRQAARSLGANRITLYFRGRVAAAGDVTVPAAHSMMGIFPLGVLEATWAATEDLSCDTAASAFAEACCVWGREHLADVPDAERVAAAAERVVDAADLSGLVITGTWAARPRPQDPPARLAHALFLLRELRGGLHFCALRAFGIGPLEATLADPDGGPERLLRTGWADEQVAALQARADDDTARRRAQAEALTDEAFGRCLAVLDPADAELLERTLLGLRDQLPAIRV